MPSSDYNRLMKNHAVLTTNFLSFEKRLDGRYTDRELLSCRAYIAFSHAEIEHYFESVARRALSKAQSRWQKFDSGGKVLSGILWHYNQKDQSLPDNPTNQNATKSRTTVIMRCFQQHLGQIDNNHGVLPKNMSALFMPIGVDSDKFDNTLIIKLENFGGARGKLVHGANDVSLPRIRDPFDDEQQDVESILTDIAPFDAMMLSHQ